jgi:hypothetical protein
MLEKIASSPTNLTKSLTGFDKKLAESAYFVDQIKLNWSDPEKVGYCVSAYVTAGDSIREYIFSRVRKQRGGQQWYQTFIKSNLALAFFATSRSKNFHELPIEIRVHPRQTRSRIDLQGVELKPLSDDAKTSPDSKVSTTYSTSDGSHFAPFFSLDEVIERHMNLMGVHSLKPLRYIKRPRVRSDGLIIIVDYYFYDWIWNENVLNVCGIHLSNLRLMIIEATAKFNIALP